MGRVDWVGRAGQVSYAWAGKRGMGGLGVVWRYAWEVQVTWGARMTWPVVKAQCYIVGC